MSGSTRRLRKAAFPQTTPSPLFRLWVPDPIRSPYADDRASQEITTEHREKFTAPPTKLIVLLAFDRGEDGELIPAFEAREMRDEGTAIRTARDLARRHVGVVTWSRTADLVNGEFGDPVVLFQHGDVPDLE